MIEIHCPNCGNIMEEFGQDYVVCHSCGIDFNKKDLDNWEDIYPTYEQVVGELDEA